MWSVKKPTYGNHIRVNRGLYYHHGIYVSDDEVIQFASLIPGHEMDPESAEVVSTSLEKFLKGGTLEVREYNEEELLNKRGDDEIVSYARNSLGKKGYDVINNNCEHFANECVFGKKSSEQVDKALDFLRNLFGGR